jgi:hypothetical protein
VQVSDGSRAGSVRLSGGCVYRQRSPSSSTPEGASLRGFQLSWSHSLPQRLHDQRGIALSVERSLRVLRPSLRRSRQGVQIRRSFWGRGPRGLPASAATLRGRSRLVRLALGVGPPSEPDRPQPSAVSLQRCGASHEVSCPFSVRGTEDPLSRGFACPVRSAFRVALPLGGLRPSEPCRPCFMPATLMGFHPPELFPPSEAGAPLDARNPLAVGLPSSSSCSALAVDSFAVRDSALRPALASPGASAGRLDFRAWHLAGVRRPRRGVTRDMAPMLSWALRLCRALSSPRLGSCFQGPPPMGFGLRDLASAASSRGIAASVALRSVNRLDGRSDASRRWSYPPEVCEPRLPSRRFGIPSDPGSWFRLGSRATSPRPADPLRVVQASYRSPSTGSVGSGTR